MTYNINLISISMSLHTKKRGQQRMQSVLTSTLHLEHLIHMSGCSVWYRYPKHLVLRLHGLGPNTTIWMSRPNVPRLSEWENIHPPLLSWILVFPRVVLSVPSCMPYSHMIVSLFIHQYYLEIWRWHNYHWSNHKYWRVSIQEWGKKTDTVLFHQQLQTDKQTKEIIADFRKNRKTIHQIQIIDIKTLERVLRVNISEGPLLALIYIYKGVFLSWGSWGELVYSRTNCSTYSCPLLILITCCIRAWFTSCSKEDRMSLQKFFEAAQNIIRTWLPKLDDIFQARCQSRATNIIHDPLHSGHHCFQRLSIAFNHSQVIQDYAFTHKTEKQCISPGCGTDDWQ